ncbi:MAG: hypothetical protein DRR19_33625 [Candidatus Parabeggiatoa sp. nov. 1]|nr:MAG: hypothetical protein DRR19_33625 [Gammaproteobacteria bacterium]
MGDDAEYYIEQLEQEAREEQARIELEQYRSLRRFCYVTDYNQDTPEVIFDWSPRGGIDWLFKLHNIYNIGKSVYYAQYEEEDGFIDGNKFRKVLEADEADLEVLLVSRHELKKMTEQIENVGVNYFEKNVFSGIIQSMICVMASKPNVEEFTFILEC